MMTVVEKIIVINDVLKDIFEFTQTNEALKEDFREYLATIGAKDISLNQMEKIFLPYVFERKINDKSVLDLYLETSPKEREIVEALAKATFSIFEVKRILKNGFELYNMVNERTYTVLSLTKMSNFRGIYAGQYITARIFEFRDEFYMIEISNILSHSQKSDAMRYAVMSLVQNPRLLYKDNPDKEKEIKQTINEMYNKFIATFNKDIILTTNKHADDIIGAFNDGEEVDLSDKICDIKTFKYFHIKELDNNYNNFLENSIGGFASHSETYDVAVIFDKDRGLYAIPFYQTFSRIFEDKDSVENAKDCILYFLTNESVPDTILNRISAEHPNFMEVINELLETNYTYDELINKYKSEYVNNTIYSSATVLYCSDVFSNMFEIISSKNEDKTKPIVQKVGRNEPCPCGSGKKYKNCCGKGEI